MDKKNLCQASQILVFLSFLVFLGDLVSQWTIIKNSYWNEQFSGYKAQKISLVAKDNWQVS